MGPRPLDLLPHQRAGGGVAAIQNGGGHADFAECGMQQGRRKGGIL
jgi:hypothetical protein